MPPLPDIAAAGFKLRLDQDHGLSSQAQRQDRRENQSGRDERHIHHQQGQVRRIRNGQHAGLQKPRVGALHRRTRGSLRSFMAIWPKPVSTAVT